MEAVADSLSTTFAALANPTRRAILARLARGLWLANIPPVPQTLASFHLRTLREAGVVTTEIGAQHMP